VRRSRRPELIRWLAAALVMAGLVVAYALFADGGPEAGEPTLASRQWLSAYLGDSKLGFGRLDMRIEGEGRRRTAVVSLTASARLGALLGDGAIEMTYELIERMDPDTLAPRSIDSRMDVAGDVTRTHVDFSPERADWEITQSGRTRTGTIALEAADDLVADLGFLLTGPVTERETFRYLNFLQLRVNEGYAEPPKADLPEGAVAGVAAMTTAGLMSVYYDADGDVVSASLPMGMELRAEAKEIAQDMGPEDYVPPLELGIGFGGESSRVIEHPERSTRLTAVLRGLRPGSVSAIEGRQKVAEAPGGGIRVEVVAQDIRRRVGAAPSIPVRGADAALLQPERFLEVGSPAITRATEEALQGETNSAAAAARIEEWVYENTSFHDQLGPILSAEDVLENGGGVCRDFAALYVAMARTAGIPSRMVLGLIYAKGGFYLHSWAESFVGEWLPVDPTRAGRPVDATHITLTRGTVADAWDTSMYVGELTVDVKDVEVGEP